MISYKATSRYGIAAWLMTLGGVCAPAISADAVRGADLFSRVGCYECHGTRGAGDGWAGPKIAPSPLPLAYVKQQIRSPRKAMPAYSSVVLSDSDIEDIYAFLRSVPVGPPADSIAQLRP